MSIAAPSTTFSLFAPERLLTAADVAALPKSLPSGDVRYELDDGRLIVMPPPGDIHSAVDSDIHFELKLQGERRGFGELRSEVGLLLRRNPDRLVGPDAAFICAASLPVRRSKEGYLETIPDLIVEVRSKNDAWAEILSKVAEYFQAGVRVVWVIDPENRTISEFRPNSSVRVFQETDDLTNDDIIPGFRMPVRNVFTKI